MTRRERSAARRRRIVANRTTSFAEADEWDLQFWQRQTPAARLSALVAIREDIRRVKGRNKSESLIAVKSRIDEPRHRPDVRDLEAVRALQQRATAPTRRAEAASRRKRRPAR